jgi:hypothetical protein
MVCKSTDKVIGVGHEGLLVSGVINNVLLVLALCGGNYFISCNRCCTVLSMNSPDTKCMGSWTDPIASVVTVEGLEISGNLFYCFSRL